MRPFVLLLLALAVAHPASAANDLPQWLEQVARQPTDDTDAPALVLLDEQMVSVAADGRLTVTRRFVVRIVKDDGRRAATAHEVYLTDSGRIRDVQGWVIGPQGATAVRKSAIIDRALVNDDLYNEARVRSISGRDQAGVGSVFGAEIVSESLVPFKQLEWDVDRSWPIRIARRTLALPTGWAARSLTINGPPVEPRVSGATYVWEFANLPRMEDEPSAPPRTRLDSRIAVDYGPAGASSFGDWPGVARWLTTVSDDRAIVTPGIARRAQSLVGDAASPMDKITRIARFIQSLQYVSLQTGLGRGGGYRPHTAEETLTRGYGDCKDKANLMRALLAAVGIRSVLISAFLGDAEYVRVEWASPQQFNHCILGILLPSGAEGSANLVHPGLGRLLIFDATDSYTPVGSLPDSLQGSRVLLVADTVNPLITLPKVSDEESRIERATRIVLNASGEATIQQLDRARGLEAIRRRAWIGDAGLTDFVAEMRTLVTRAVPGATNVDVEPKADGSELTLTYRVPRFTQTVGALRLARPRTIRPEQLPDVSRPRRTLPLALERLSIDESMTIELPSGMKLDEPVPPVRLQTAYGEYSRSSDTTADRVIVTRRLRLRDSTVPRDDYDQLRGFIQRIQAADELAVVLVGSAAASTISEK